KKNPICNSSRELLRHINVDHVLIPLKVFGDGNCLFRAISLFLYGNDTFHIELRILGDDLNASLESLIDNSQCISFKNKIEIVISQQKQKKNTFNKEIVQEKLEDKTDEKKISLKNGRILKIMEEKKSPIILNESFSESDGDFVELENNYEKKVDYENGDFDFDYEKLELKDVIPIMLNYKLSTSRPIMCERNHFFFLI
ncbi:unnamed protein product, partial [Brachionus calyciflorus]